MQRVLTSRTAIVAAVVAVLSLTLLLPGTGVARSKICRVPNVGVPIDDVWAPNMDAAVAYAHSRAGDISMAVRTDGKFYGYREDTVVPSASLLKAMLLVAYLDMQSVRDRDLNGGDYSMLDPMIEFSNDNAAGTVLGIVGPGRLDGVARLVGMTRFAVMSPWGLSHVTASDYTKFFLHIDSFIAPKHVGYAMHLLASITPSQRWGIGEVSPKGWDLYFKGGWGSGTGAIDHQVALLRRGCARVSVAVMTLNDGSHAYGKETLRGIFARLLKKLPSHNQERRVEAQK